MKFARKFVIKFCAVLSLALFCTGVLTTTPFPAQALNLSHSSILAANSSMVDDVLGEGTTNKIEGKTKRDIGTVEQAIKETQAEAEGSLKQAQGKAQQDLGELQNRGSKAGSDLDDASDNIVDAVKDFFGQ